MNAVLRLVQPFFKSNRNLTVDNFFTGMALAEKLWEEKITLIGTVNNNRNFLPESFLKSKNREVLST